MKIKFYGATWCSDCRRSKQFLDENNADYEYINLDENPDAAEEVEEISPMNLEDSVAMLPVLAAGLGFEPR